MGRYRLLLLSAGALAAILLPARAAGQTSAISLSLDPSIRASGMGRASTAVFWGGDPNYWANPALVGYTQGIRYEYGKTQLVPDLADDVYFSRRRLAAGGHGIGLCFYGNPFSNLGRDLTYGTSQARSETGEFLGEFESYETIDGFSFGANAVEVLETALAFLTGSAPQISRFADLSYGHGWNDVDVVLIPAYLGTFSAEDMGATQDRGYLLRGTPYNSIDFPGYLPGLDDALFSGDVGVRLDGSYGRGEQNYARAALNFDESDRADTMWTATRTGWAARLSVSASQQGQARLRERGKGWLLDLFHPFFAWGMAWDEQQLEVSTLDRDRPGFRTVPTPTTGHGWEVTIGNVFSYRHGHYKDPDGSIDDGTSGWSLGLQYAGMAGFRYDRATVPQAYDPDTGEQLADVTHNGFVAFVDPLALIAYLRR